MSDAHVNQRRFERARVRGLYAEVSGKLVEVADISIGGMKLVGGPALERGPLRFKLIPIEDGRLLVNESIQAVGTVTRVESDGVGVEFTSPTWTLVKMVVRRMGEISEINPFVVK